MDLKSKLTLLSRLRAHIGRRVTIEAQDFASEAGLLQAVGRKFIKVMGQFFVPSTLQKITLLDIPTNLLTTPVSIRSTYRGTFSAGLVNIGADYIEIIENQEGTRRRLLIPLNKVISIEITS